MMFLILAAAVSTVAQTEWLTGTYVTGYWDCCKPSCSWRGKGSVNKPVRFCHKSTGIPISNTEERDVCDGGSGTTCTDNQPFVVNSGLTMGFAAAAVGGVSGLNGDSNCGQCYELRFMDTRHYSGPWAWGGAHPDLVGKTHIVQVTNIGYDVSGKHSFDLQIPSAGMGAFTAGCPNQFPGYSNSAFDCGKNYGGCDSKSGCAALPPELQAGCEWRFDWFKWLSNDGRTNNPYVQFRRVKCPSQLTDITGTIPTDDNSFPTIDPSSYGDGSETTLPPGGATTTSIPGVSTTPQRDTSQCSDAGENCQSTKCCRDASLACYEKNQWWAGCKPDCTPGIDPDELVQHQTPWSCTRLSASTTSISATTDALTTTVSTTAQVPTTTTVTSTTTATSTTTVLPATTVASTTSTVFSATTVHEVPTTTVSSTIGTTEVPMTTVSSTPTTTAMATSSLPSLSGCSQVGESCLSSKCCANPSLTCFGKNQWWATCMASCTAGIDFDEPPEFQTPWSCDVLQATRTSSTMATTVSTTLASATSSLPPLSGCSQVGESCLSSKCCANPSLTCFGKNQWWATCMATCTPGVDLEEPPEFQTPWSCEVPSTSTSMMRATATLSTTTVDPAVHEGIKSGDIIFLKTFSGTGKMLDVDGATVHARWEGYGTLQAIKLEKNVGSTVYSGDIVFLTAHTGAQFDVEGEAVQARWQDKGTWQSFAIEKAGGGVIFPSDIVCFKVHTGKYIGAVADGAVRAVEEACADGQRMQIEKEDASAIFSGSSVYLMAHTSRHLDVQADLVQARYNDHGSWQRFTIENYGGRAVYSGDTIFLAAHTGNFVDVEGDTVSARWPERGGWQALVIEKASGGAIRPGDAIFLRAHTGNYVDVEGSAVRARWRDRGAWQSLIVHQSRVRLLHAYSEDALAEIAEGSVSGITGMAFGLGASIVLVFAAFLAATQSRFISVADQRNQHKVHPEPEQDDHVCD